MKVLRNKGYRVYFNLTKKCYSVQHYVQGKGWRLWRHAEHMLVLMRGTKVYQSGRRRVLKTGEKNVHAYILCENVDFFGSALHLDRAALGVGKEKATLGHALYYNPYKTAEFKWRDRQSGKLHDVYHVATLYCSIEDGRPLVFKVNWKE